MGRLDDADGAQAAKGGRAKCSLPCYASMGHAIVAGWFFDEGYGCWARSAFFGGGRLPRGYDPYYEEVPVKWWGLRPPVTDAE